MPRGLVIKSTFIAVAFCFTLVAHAMAESPKPVRVPPGPLVPALETLSKQMTLELIYEPKELKSFQTAGVSGLYTAQAAVRILLKGTPLQVRVDPSGAMAIVPPKPARAQARADSPVASSTSDGKEGRTRSSNGFRLARMAQATDAGTAAIAPANTPPRDSNTPATLEEVVVTAEKRTERLQDVPVPVTAISAQGLVDSNQVRLEDYYTRVPGLSVTPSDFGGTQLTIRGLTTGGFTNPTVGITVDDVPYGSSTGLGSGQEVPDLDPSDLARIEVLRGPQGTLYGASSIGGLLKYVTVDPSTSALSGQAQVGTSGAENGSDPGYDASGAVNIPLSDTVAMRASGFTRRDPGYIDNPVYHQEGVNQAYVDGGHVAMLWAPSSEWSLKLGALLQRSWADAYSLIEVAPGLSGLQQNDVVGSGGYDKTFQAYSATLNGKIGISELTAVTGYSSNRSTEALDYTPSLGTLTETEFGVTGTPLVSYVTTRRFTQEIRLTTPIGSRLVWLMGLYYDHEGTAASEDLSATAPATGQFVGRWFHVTDPSTFAEQAAFTDLTVKLTDAFDIQFGGRESQNRQAYGEDFVGPYASLFLGSSPFIYPQQHTKDDSFTYLVTPRLKLSPDLMVYARVASGYRPGGPNVNTGTTGLPTHYDPDTTENYEIGVKGDVLQHLIAFDASLFYIDWKDIQLQLIDPSNGIEYFANGSRAKSQGVEMSVDVRPWTGMHVSLDGAWTDAVLTEPLPADRAVGASGDRLPYSARFAGNLSVEQQFHVVGEATGFVGASLGYTGSRIGVFPSIFALSSARQTLPAYARTDIRTGLVCDAWRGTLFVNNVTDRRGVLAGGIGTTVPDAFYVIEPRTVGIQLTKSF